MLRVFCRPAVSLRSVLHNRTRILLDPCLFRNKILATSVAGIRNVPTNADPRHGRELSASGFVDYDEEKKTLDLRAPKFYNFAEAVIDKWARKEEVSDVRQGLPALWWVGDNGREVKWTFQDLADNSNRVANILTGPCQLVPGDRVLVILPKLPQWWLLNIACIRAGVVMIPGSYQLTANDIRDRLQRSSAKCVICDDATAEKIDEVIKVCPSVSRKVVVDGRRSGWLVFEDLYFYCSNVFQTVKTRSSEPSMLFFTSGTTGPSKMAEHSHSSYGIGHKLSARYWFDLVPTDIFLNLSDLGWAKSAYAFYSAWTSGACLFVDQAGKFDPERVLRLLQDYPITVFCGPATVYRYLIGSNPEKYNLKSVRHYASGGEAVNPDLIEAWLDSTGQLIHEGYGQTETTVLCCSPKCLPVRPGSMGKAVPGVDVVVVDSAGKPVEPNTEGEIAVRLTPRRPVNLFTKYVDNPDKTSKVFTEELYLTGDQARIDEEGYFWFSSRKDDLIMSAGYRIGPQEVESTLLEHHAVLEAAVVGSPDESRGEVVKAFIVLHPDHRQPGKEEHLKQELVEHVKRGTAPYKYPRKIEFVDSLPRTVSGKIRRVELRDKEWNN